MATTIFASFLGTLAAMGLNRADFPAKSLAEAAINPVVAAIGNAMASRALTEHLRAMGEVTGGPKPMDKRARSTFLSALDEAVVKLRRQRPPIPPAGR